MKDRLKEPTSYIALSLIATGIGQLFKLDHVEPVVNTLHAIAEPMSRGDYTQAGMLIIGGLLGFFLPERGKK